MNTQLLSLDPRRIWRRWVYGSGPQPECGCEEEGLKIRPFSLNRRLILAVIASQLLLGTGLVLIGTSFSKHYLRKAFDVFLQGRAESMAALVYYRDDGVPGLLFNADKIPPSRHEIHKDLFLIKSDRDNLLEYSPGIDPAILAHVPADAHFLKLHYKGAPYRAIILRHVAILDTEVGEPLPLPTLTVVYAAPTMDIDQQVSALGVTIALVSLLVLIPALILAVWSIRRALTPLNDLVAAASGISVERWGFEPSDEARSTRELKPLIGAIQTVLTGLEEAFTRQREFLGDAAHELKTSLAILKSTLQRLLNKPLEREEYERGLAMMNGDCLRLERLLNRMLQSARAEQRIATGHEQEPEPVEVTATCEAALARMAQFAAEREVRLEFLPEQEASVRAESADLELIWLNLLENAVQYSARGSVVRVRVTAEDGLARVSVADQGCGIDSAHLPHIFKRFYRADSSRSRATGGFGLGLAISKSLVDFYCGHIYVESVPAHGTCFKVELPAETSGRPATEQQHELHASIGS